MWLYSHTLIHILFCSQQSQPTYRITSLNRLLDYIFSNLNSSIDQAASRAVKFLSQWCKGRIRPRHPRPTKRRGPKSRRQRLKLPLPIFLYLFAGQTQATKPTPRKAHFSSHPFTIGIDSRASACMSLDPKDFITKLTPILVQVKTYDATTTPSRHHPVVLDQ